jgi:hypothetical protein
MKPGLCNLAKLIEVAGYQLDCELIPATHNRLDYPIPDWVIMFGG